MRLITCFTTVCASVAIMVSCAKYSDEPSPQPVDSGDLKEYVIIFSNNEEEDGIGMTLAMQLRDMIKGKCGVELKYQDHKLPRNAKEILLGRVDVGPSVAYYEIVDAEPQKHTFDTHIEFKSGKIVLAGGSAWAVLGAMNEFVNNIVPSFKYEEGKVVPGTVRGAFLFPLTAGANLRIWDNNVWNHGSKNADAWKAKGLDCTDQFRGPEFVQTVRAYMPDAVCFQEFSKGMDNAIRGGLVNYRYQEVPSGSSVQNYTPIFYYPESLELVESKYWSFGTGVKDYKYNNSNSKSYTAAVFRHKNSGRNFILVSTHLWWQSESALAGSDNARKEQAQEIVTFVKSWLEKYNCPAFVCGDMNCKLSSAAMGIFTDNQYKTLCELAESGWNRDTWGDGSRGWHTCDANNVGTREGFPHVTTDKGKESIDQFFLYNASGTSVKIKKFERVYTKFTVLLTDHYPNYADITID